jgi:ElaB/YqjD/DUF883 family membrane-anchored ribosome-binding protein
MTQQKAPYPLDYSNGRADSGRDRVRELADSAADKFQDVTENAEAMAGRLAGQILEYGQKAQDAMKQVKPHIEKSMKDQPMATLAVASVIGFVLGALWRK